MTTIVPPAPPRPLTGWVMDLEQGTGAMTITLKDCAIGRRVRGAGLGIGSIVRFDKERVTIRWEETTASDRWNRETELAWAFLAERDPGYLVLDAPAAVSSFAPAHNDTAAPKDEHPAVALLRVIEWSGNEATARCPCCEIDFGLADRLKAEMEKGLYHMRGCRLAELIGAPTERKAT